MRLRPFIPPSWPTSERNSAAPFHDHRAVLVLRPSAAGATVARGTSAPLAVTRHDRSGPRPSPAYTAATPWPSPGHESPEAQPEAAANSREATQNCHIPSHYVVEAVTADRKPPEVRICRLRNQSAVGTRPPSTSTP